MSDGVLVSAVVYTSAVDAKADGNVMFADFGAPAEEGVIDTMPDWQTIPPAP